MPTERAMRAERVNEFARKIAEVMLEISSSHVYFIFQQAFDKTSTMDWSKVVKKLDEIIADTKTISSEYADLEAYVEYVNGKIADDYPKGIALYFWTFEEWKKERDK